MPVTTSILTVDSTVSEALAQLPGTIQLLNDCFVDYVAQRSDDSRVVVKLPGRRVAGYVERHPLLTGVPFSALYQHEWREIDGSFPYQELTLREIGIPEHDVLCVTTQDKEYYYELSN